ncbi:copper resistance CopC family protein [Lysinibacillus yapensis]|uniref:copper resistance CopC family protein n=1 Tax=Ureibacillus yapensis TaxID=2304605 RepID=UPI001314E1D2|nr:copper resistance protein CopC [Lysinibacillus yapensis]
MKRFTIAAAAVLLATTISHTAFAHSNLGASNPADGEVVAEPLNEITLEFEGQIEQGSFIEVTTTSGQAVEIQDITIGEGTLTGTVAEPLPNGDYSVNWSIISADGHPLEGDFSFKVDVPVTEAEEVSEEAAEASETTGTAEETTEANNQTTEAEEESSSGATILIVVLVIAILAGGIFFFKKRK